MRCYLNLLEYLSQAWLDQNVIFMMLATLKVYFFSSALIVMISATKDSGLPLCRQLERLANELEQTPAQISRVTESIVETLADNLITLIKKLVYLVSMVAKSIVSLLLELYLGTLTCLITALVKGTLELVSDILSDITNFIQNAINAVLKDFNAALSGLSSVINTLTTAISAVEKFFTPSDKSQVSNNINKVNLTVASLTSISIPITWINDIEDLSNDVPDFEEVLSNVSSLLTSPITHFTEGFANTSFNFILNDSYSPVNTTKLSAVPFLAETLIIPQKSVQFSNGTNSVCDEIESILTKTVSEIRELTLYIILGLAIGTALYGLVSWILAYFKYRKVERLYKSLTEIEDRVQVGNTICRYEHGIMAVFTSKMSPSAQWLYSYVSTPNLTRCFVLGLIGWLMVLLQFITLNKAQKLLKQIAASEIVSTSTQGKLEDNYAQLLNDAQGSLDKTVEEVNDVLFSSIHNTSSLILDGIDSFQNSVNGTINTVFGNSFLAKPLRTIIYCTIGRKVDTIEEGLQWIQKNTLFEAPTLDKVYMEAAFAQSTTNVSGMSSTIAEQILESTQTIIKSQKKALWKEFFISTALVAVWVLYLLIGLSILSKRKAQTVGASNRVSTQQISWPTQLSDEGQREYGYPYNDPYGVPYTTSGDAADSVISKQHMGTPDITSGQESPVIGEIPNDRSDSLPAHGWQ